MELSLKGKKIHITGAGAGIGLACAEAFVKAGADVAICDVEQARLNEAKLKIKNSDFKNEVIQIKLEQMNVEKNTVDLLFEIFENCQLARYTPLNIDAMSDDYNKTKQFIEQLEKY